MNIVIAMDSFKGSMTSIEAGQAAADGIRRVYPEASIHVRPVADGGEGTVSALVEGLGGKMQTVQVCGPLGDKVNASYGIVAQTRTAIMEMSAAAGLTLVPEEKRNPMHTTTYGVGEMIVDAVRKGCRHFLVGIGGSATNDGGVGMLQALGFAFLDEKGISIPYGAEGLCYLHTIREENKLPELEQCSFQIACDVTNPLAGELGCSAVYGPQKGADPKMVSSMEKSIIHYSNIVRHYFPNADAAYPGAGAAGGMGYAFRTFLNGELCSGVELILHYTDAERYIRDADIVLTGEGRLDGQTSMGKAPIGVARIAKKYGKPVIALAGCTMQEAARCHENGIHAYFSILHEAVSLEKALDPQYAAENMRNAAEQVFRVIKTFNKGV